MLYAMHIAALYLRAEEREDGARRTDVYSSVIPPPS